MLEVLDGRASRPWVSTLTRGKAQGQIVEPIARRALLGARRNSGIRGPERHRLVVGLE